MPCNGIEVTRHVDDNGQHWEDYSFSFPRFHYMAFRLITIAIMLVQPLAFAADDFATLESPVSADNAPLFVDIPSVYSASKYEQKVTKAPASISIVTADEIKKYGYRTFGQVLSSLRGFYNTQDRNNGYAGARGFGLPSDVNSRLLLLVDGHRFNDSIYDAFNTTEGFPVDLDIIERVEVVRGPVHHCMAPVRCLVLSMSLPSVGGINMGQMLNTLTVQMMPIKPVLAMVTALKMAWKPL